MIDLEESDEKREFGIQAHGAGAKVSVAGRASGRQMFHQAQRLCWVNLV
jgi:hypothetical protein